MRFWIIFLALSASLTVFSFSALTYPDTLTCHEILPVFGSGKIKDFQYFQIKNINSGQLFSEDMAFTERGRMQIQRQSDQVIFNFSEGEQIQKLTFKKEDLSLLSQGRSKSLNGLHEIGRWRPEGDRTDRLTVIKCQR